MNICIEKEAVIWIRANSSQLHRNQPRGAGWSLSSVQKYGGRRQRFSAGLGTDEIQECLVGREHERAGTQSLVAAGYIAGSAREFADVLRVVTVGDGPGRHAVVA